MKLPYRPNFPRLRRHNLEEHKKTAETAGVKKDCINFDTYHEDTLNEMRKIRDIFYDFGFQESVSSSMNYATWTRSEGKNGISVLTLVYQYNLYEGKYDGFQYGLTLNSRYDDGSVVAGEVTLWDLINQADEYLSIKEGDTAAKVLL